MKKCELWNGHEVLYLKKHYKDTSYEVMGEVLGRTKCSITGAARRLGLKRPLTTPNVWTEERVTFLKERWDKGDSASNIAYKLGRGFTRNMVIGKAHRLNLARREPRRLPPELKRARAIASEQRRLARLRAREEKRMAAKKIILPVSVPRPDSLNIHIKETKKRQCRYIDGDDRLCCGHETKEGLSWCDFHYGVVYRDRRTTAVARFDKQSLAHRQRPEHSQSEVQTMDRRGQISLTNTKSPQGNRAGPG